MLFVAGACWGQATDPLIDPLHGCIIGTSCFDNGTVTPTTTNPLPNFTFTASSGPLAGDFLVEILIPDNALNAASLSFDIGATSAGPSNSSTISPTAAVLEGHWTSGGLGAFLGLTLANGSPKNDITAWLPYTQANGDAGANGYEVYQVDLGDNQLQSPSNPTVPVLTLSGSNLPIASLLAGFLFNTDAKQPKNSGYISTANSGALFEADTPPSVPEPISITLLATACLFIGNAYRKKVRRS